MQRWLQYRYQEAVLRRTGARKTLLSGGRRHEETVAIHRGGVDLIDSRLRRGDGGRRGNEQELPRADGPSTLQPSRHRTRKGGHVDKAVARVSSMSRWPVIGNPHRPNSRETRPPGPGPIGRHFPYDPLRDNVEGVARDAKALESPTSAVPGFRIRTPSPEAVPRGGPRIQPGRRRAGQARNQVLLSQSRLRVPALRQGTLFDLLATQTDPKTVYFQMDVLWTVLPGQDPVRAAGKVSGSLAADALERSQKGRAHGQPVGRHRA